MPTSPRSWRPLVVLLAALLVCTTAAAQPGSDGVPEPPHASAPPKLTQPLALMVPGLVTLAVGGIMFSQTPDGVDLTRWERASFGLMGMGTALVGASIFYFGARIAKRVRWRRDRRWDECDQGLRRCDRHGPSLYPPAFLLVPGGVLVVVGTTLIAVDPSGPGGPSTDSSAADGGKDTSHYLPTGCALIGVGATLLIAGSLHLAVRLRRRSAWQKRHDVRQVLGSLRMAPTLTPFSRDAARPVGVALSARF